MRRLLVSAFGSRGAWLLAALALAVLLSPSMLPVAQAQPTKNGAATNPPPAPAGGETAAPATAPTAAVDGTADTGKADSAAVDGKSGGDAAPAAEGDAPAAAATKAKAKAKAKARVEKAPEAAAPESDPAKPAKPSPAAKLAITHQAPLQADTYDGVARTWRRFIELIDKEDFAEILLRVERLDQVRQESGVRNLFDAATALTRLASERAADRDPTTARHMLEAALRIAPDLPHPHYVMASILWKEDKGAVGKAASHILQGWTKEWRHLPSRMRSIAHTLSILQITFMGVILLFTLVLLRRHFPLLAHDAKHLFPRGVSSLQAGLFVLLVLFTPLVLSLGVLTFLLLCMVSVWWYQNRQEKVVTIVILLLVAATPLMARLTANAAGFFGSELSRYHRCLSGACSRADVEQLEETCREDPTDRLACLTIGTVRARQGAKAPALLEDAVKFLEPISEQGGPLARATLITYGNALQAKAVAHCMFNRRVGSPEVDQEYKDLAESAMAAYDAAATVGAAAAGMFNKSELLSRLGDKDASDAALRAAQNADGALVMEVQRVTAENPTIGPCSEVFNLNRMLAAPEMPTRTLFSVGLREKPLSAVSLPVAQGVLLGRLPLPMLSMVGAIGLALIVLLWLLRSKVHPTWRCSQCNKVGCVRCRRELGDLDICEECLFIRVKGSFVDAKELWFRERRIQAEQDARRRTGRILALLVPGVGHLYRGRALGGVILMGLCATAVLHGFIRGGFAPESVLAPNSADTVSMIAWLSIAGVIYLISLVSAYRTK